MTRDEITAMASDFMCHPLSRSIADCEKAGEMMLDAAAEIDRLNDRVKELIVENSRLQNALTDAKDALVGKSIDDAYAGRLALMLECAILDPNGFFTEACALLDAYKAEWEKINPLPPTFMGEPMPPERRAIFAEIKAKREEKK